MAGLAGGLPDNAPGEFRVDASCIGCDTCTRIGPMERLLDRRFERVLPGHGWGWRAPSAEAMRAEVARRVGWMRRA